MTAILKVDTIQDTSGNNIINESSNTITIGASGDTTNIIGTYRIMVQLFQLFLVDWYHNKFLLHLVLGQNHLE